MVFPTNHVVKIGPTDANGTGMRMSFSIRICLRDIKGGENDNISGGILHFRGLHFTTDAGWVIFKSARKTAASQVAKPEV